MRQVSRMRWVLLAILMLPHLAWASEPQMLGQYQKWTTYQYQESQGTVCYAMTYAESTRDAKGKTQKIKSRGRVLLQVTRRSFENNQPVVSFVAGHSIKSKTTVIVQIDKKQFKLRAEGDSAWTESTAQDAEIIKTIRNGKNLTITHDDRKGNDVVDAFSLKGAGSAIAAMEKCS